MTEKVKLINLCNHIVVLCDEGSNAIYTLHESGQTAYEVHSNHSEWVNGVRVYRNGPSTVFGIPDPQPGVFYVVSNRVRLAAPERKDILAPTDLVRHDGNVIMARALQGNW